MPNREIKFRAWDIWNKKFWNSNYFFYLHLDGYLIEEVSGDNGELESLNRNKKLDDRFILQQFTGLKDKNGKEIYEGDIIKFQMTRTVFVNHPVMTATKDQLGIYQGVVRWKEFGWRPFIDGEVRECEIVGNINERSSN